MTGLLHFFSTSTRDITRALSIQVDRSKWPNHLIAIAGSYVLDYFICGHIKDLIEHRRDNTEAEVAIRAVLNTITPELAYRATRSMTRKAELCLREERRHFDLIFALKYF